MPAVFLSAFAGVGSQLFDNNGNPLAGGKIYVYAAGTTTPLPSYTTIDGDVEHANPIILDSSGRVPGGQIWITLVQYKFVTTTSTDVQIAVFDNIGLVSEGGVTTGEIANGAVTTPKLADDAVTLAKMADESVGSAQLIEDSVQLIHMTDDSVGTAELIDLSVTSDKLAAGVALANLQPNSITHDLMTDNSVGTAELIDGSVTLAKLAEDAQITTPAVLAAMALAPGGAVGTYAFMFDNRGGVVTANITIGGTLAGSSLRYAGLSRDILVSADPFMYTDSSNVPGGTWQCMGYSRADTEFGPFLQPEHIYRGVTLWLRIA